MARKTSGKLPSGHFQKTLRHRIAQPPRIVGFRVGFQQRRQSRDDAAPHRIGRLRFSANQCRLFVIQVGHEPVETRLRAAVAVSRHLSFRRAAAEMHVSQPALSTSISELEQTLGLTLFDRTSRSVALTELGSTFIKRATRILEDVDRLLFEPCMEDPFFFVCHRGHRLAQRSAVTWAELENEHLIALSTTSGMHRIVQGELLRRRVHITKSTPVTYLSTVHGMLEADFGVSILPSMALPVANHPLLVSVPLIKPGLSRTVGICRRRDRSPSPAAQGLMEVIHTVIESRETVRCGPATGSEAAAPTAP